MKIFITGVTGFLAGELLVMLSKIECVEKIFCLVRAKDRKQPRERIERQFLVHGDFFDEKKIIPVYGDLSDENLSKQLISNESLRSVDTIIHAGANTYFSPIYKRDIQRVNVGGTNNILKWATSLNDLKTFVYVGTAWICGAEKTNRIVYEDESPNADYKQLVEYCRSKTTGETNVRAAIPPEKLLVVRPSTVMGDTRQWAPRSYTILWAIAAFDMMRLVPMSPRTNCDIVPVDYAARSIIELLLSKRKYDTYHISSGTKSSTNMELLLGAVNVPGKIPIKFVDYDLIREIRLWSKNKLAGESRLDSYGKYLQYWSSMFGNNGNLRTLLGAIDYYFQFVNMGLIFDNSRLLEDTSVGNPEPAHVYMARNKGQLSEIDVIEGIRTEE